MLSNFGRLHKPTNIAVRFPVKYTIHRPELAENFQNVNPHKILFLQDHMLARLVHGIGISTDRILLAGGSDPLQ